MSHLSNRVVNVIELLAVDTGGTDFLNIRSLVDDVKRLVPQSVENRIPVVEALAAWRAAGGGTDVAAVALVAFLTAYTLVTDADTSLAVALSASGADNVTLARVALHVRVAPVVRLAFVTAPAAETRLALAGTLVWVASVNIIFHQNRKTSFLRKDKRRHLPIRNATNNVALARIAALSAGDSPVVLFTGVTELSDDVGKTGTLSSPVVARSDAGIGTEDVALTGLAVLLESVTVKVSSADLAVETVGVPETLQALAGLRIAVAWPVEIGVVAALAGLALAARGLGVAVEIIGAGVAARAGVALVALADDVVADGVEGTAVGVGVAALQGSGTGTGSAGDVDTDAGITVERLDTAVAVVAGGGVAARLAGAGFRVATVRVAVALAAPAVREVPEAGLALTAASSVGVGSTLAAASILVTEVVQCADAIAVAGHATFGSETVGARATAVTTTTHHVGLTLTITTVVRTDQTMGSGRVALAGCENKRDLTSEM